MLEVIDDFLPQEKFEDYKKIHVDTYFPWFFMPSTTATVSHDHLQGSTLENSVIREFPGLIHTFFENSQSNNSPYEDHAVGLLESITQHFCQDIVLKRMRSNLLYPLDRKNDIEHLKPHVDSMHQHMVGLYYINDTDGPTRFFAIDNDICKITHTVDSKQNRLIVFNGDKLHAGQCPQNAPYRMCTNINFEFTQ